MPPRPHLAAHPGLKAAGRLAVGRLLRNEPSESTREAASPPGPEDWARRARQRSRLSRGLLVLAVGCEVAVLLLIVSIADQGRAGIRDWALPLALLGVASLVCSWLGHVVLRGEQESHSTSPGQANPR